MARDEDMEAIATPMSLAFAPDVGLSLGTPKYSPFISQSNLFSPVFSPEVLVPNSEEQRVKLFRRFSPGPLLSVYIFM